MMKFKQEKFQVDYMQNYGEELQVALENTPTAENINITAFINRIELLILTLIKKTSPLFDETKLSEYQEENLWQAMLEQAYYVINVGDYSIISGVDFINNSAMSNELINSKRYSPLAIDILKSSGLLYTGLRRGRYDYYI